MKTLKETLARINKQYADIDKIIAWAKTPNGKKFYKFFGRTSVEYLERQYRAPKLHVEDLFEKTNVYLYVRKKVGYNAPEARFKPVYGFTKALADKQSSGALKLPQNASKEELMVMNGMFAKDHEGNLIQATDKDGRKFWNAVTNKKIYKRARQKKTGLQLAEKCHMYELHKMAKWDRRNPAPTHKQLCFELFPEIAMAAYKTSRGLFESNVRNELANLYCHTGYAVPLLKMYSVHHTTGYMGQTVAYEKELDPYIYGWPLCVDRPVHESMISVAKRVTDPTMVALKVYDNRGAMRDTIRIAA